MNKLLATIILFIWEIGLTYSQSSVLKKNIKIDAKDISIREIFQQISKQTNCFFTYNPEHVLDSKKITYKTDKTSTENVLNNILSDSSLIYRLIDDHIVICKKTDTPPILQTYSSDSLKYRFVSGKIVNAKNGKAIPFASIGILNTTIGTVANSNGFFSLKFKNNYNDSTFFISNLSYNTKYIKVYNLKKNENVFGLIENIVSIQEVIIKAHDPEKLIQKAIGRIKSNYCQETAILSAFYREGVLKKSEISNFSEAIIKIRKTPYKTTFLTDKIKVEKSRKIINYEKTDTVFLKLKDGLYSTLELDFIKHGISFFNSLEMSDYNYRTTDIVTYGEKLVYVVSFEQKPNIDDVLYKGKFYIETNSFAIIAADFEYNFKAAISNPNFVAKKIRRFKVRAVSAKYNISYRSANNRYFLNHVRANLEFKLRKKRKVFPSKYSVFLETVIFNIDTVNVTKFNKKEIEKKNKVFVDNHYSYDPNFWGESNFLKPEKYIEDALSKIIVRLGYLK